MLEIRMPKFGLSMETGTITKWYKHPGDTVRKGDVLVEIESEKITNDVESPLDGFIKTILVQESESKAVGEIIGYIAETEEELKQENRQETPPTQQDNNIEEKTTKAPIAQLGKRGSVSASPRAKSLARDHSIDLSTVQGTGPEGRIIERDVLDCIAKHTQTARKEPLSPLRKEIAERLFKSYESYVLVTNMTKVDMTELLEIKKKLIPDVSVTAILIKCLGSILQKYHEFNVHFDGNSIEKFSTVNIGVAVDTDKGLIVPVIKDADTLSAAEANERLRSLVELARTNKLKQEDVEGSHFTITNLGMMRTDMFTPVLNGQEVGILGIGRSAKELVVKDDNSTAIRTVAYFSLSYDHRIIDGALAARFLGSLAEVIENESLLREVLKIQRR